MTLTLNGSNNTISGLAVGGLPDGIVDNDMIANTTIAEAKLAANVNTITDADQWVVTADFAANTDTIITSNWARPNYARGTVGLIGSGMSESSGVFTFPSTGIWKINFQTWTWDGGTNRYIRAYIMSTDNNSDYDLMANMSQSEYRDSGNYDAGLSLSALFDVTDTSTHKVKFNVVAETSVTWNGHANRMDTGATFTRLGDT